MSAPVPMVALFLLAAAAALASPDAAASDGSSGPSGTSAAGGYTTSFVASARSGSKHGDGYGHGHGGKATGSACIVKGSYCSCHYCKCEKGHIHCNDKHGYGKKYCFGSTEGQYCHCDFCKCSKGFGSTGYGKCH